MEPDNELFYCGTYPGVMEMYGGHIGGVYCKSGLVVGTYVIIQNTFQEYGLSISEITAYGLEW